MKPEMLISAILFFASMISYAQTQDAGNEAPTATDTIEVKDLKAQPVVQIRFKAKREEIGGKLGMAYGSILAHVAKSGGKATLMPLSRYYGEEDGVVDMAAAIAVEKPVNGEGDIEATQLPAGKAAVAWHVGHYDKLAESYARVQQWIAANGHQVSGQTWEIYWTDPAAEPNPEKWETQIFMPLSK